MGILGISGSGYYTADSVIGTTGEPTRVYSATWLSHTAVGDLVLRNGSSASGDIYVNAVGDADDTVTLNFENGLLFPGGCFFDKDATTVSVVIEYTKEQ